MLDSTSAICRLYFSGGGFHFDVDSPLYRREQCHCGDSRESWVIYGLLGVESVLENIALIRRCIAVVRFCCSMTLDRATGGGFHFDFHYSTVSNVDAGSVDPWVIFG